MSATITGELTQSKALELFRYDFITGVLSWREDRQGQVKAGDKAGDKAGTVMNNGSGKRYLSVKVSGERYLAHRICWLYVHGRFPPDCIDHVNGNGLDNRMINLRAATRLENQRNQKISARSKTGVMGVSWDRRSSRWIERIGSSKSQNHLGALKDFFEAVCKRKSEEIKAGYHINHGQHRPL